MLRTIGDFQQAWTQESAITAKVLRALTDPSLSQQVVPGGRTLGRVAWHVVLSVSEMGRHAGLAVEGPSEQVGIPDVATMAATYERSARSLADGVDPALALRYFEFHSLACSGYLPELWECALCHRKLEATTNYFSPAAAGLLCPNCRGKEGLDRPTSVDCVKVLRFFTQNECPALARLRLKPRLATEIEDLMQGYVTYVLDREVASAKWLHELRSENGQAGKAPDGFIGSQPAVESGAD